MEAPRGERERAREVGLDSSRSGRSFAGEGEREGMVVGCKNR
jgi:hypothetical protein